MTFQMKADKQRLTLESKLAPETLDYCISWLLLSVCFGGDFIQMSEKMSDNLPLKQLFSRSVNMAETKVNLDHFKGFVMLILF